MSNSRTSVRPSKPVAAYWSLKLCPDAGEAGGTFVPSLRRQYTGVRGMAEDPERSRAEAARRARKTLRRYGVANRLNRFGTLTYGDPRCTDPDQLRDDVGQFFRDLRKELGGTSFPYVWVPELHKDNVHWHVHFTLQNYVPRTLIEQVWGRGFIKMKLIGDLPVGSGTRDEARIAARYLSKYLGKTFNTDLAGRHRYEVAQGFKPRVIELKGRTARDVIDQASERMGARPDHYWNSDQVDDWPGAPSIRVEWR